MRKTLALLLTLTMLLGAFAISASAVETVEDGCISISNVKEVGTLADGTPSYVCDGTATITILEDLVGCAIHYWSAQGDWMDINFNTTYGDQSSPVFDTTNMVVTMTDTGDTYTMTEYIEGVLAETIDEVQEVILPVGSSFDILLVNSLIAIEVVTVEEEYEIYYVNVVESDDSVAETEESVEVVTGIASASSDTIIVDGETVAFDVYCINENNYFKIRDLATVVNGSEKSFGVDWDEELYVINLTSGQDYEAVAVRWSWAMERPKPIPPTPSNCI